MYESSDKDLILTYYRRTFYYDQYFRNKKLCNQEFLFYVYMHIYEAIVENIGPVISEIYLELFCTLLEERNTTTCLLFQQYCSSQNIDPKEEIECFIIKLSGVFINDIIMESESNISVMKKRLIENTFNSNISKRIWSNVIQNINRVIDGQIITEFTNDRNLFKQKFERSCEHIENFLQTIELREFEQRIRDDQTAFISVRKHVLEEVFTNYKGLLFASLFEKIHAENDELVESKNAFKRKNFYLSFLLDDVNSKEYFVNFTNAMKIGLRLYVMFLYFASEAFKDTTRGRNQKAQTKYTLKSLIKKHDSDERRFQFYYNLIDSLQASNTYLPLLILANELHLDELSAATLANNLKVIGTNRKSFPNSFNSISELLYARSLYEKLIVDTDLETFENPFLPNSKPFFSSAEIEAINQAKYNLSLIQIDNAEELNKKPEAVLGDDYLLTEKLLAYEELLEELGKYMQAHELSLTDIIIYNAELKEQNVR